MKVLDLFSGIGAFALGVQRAGCQIIAFAETDRFCSDLLAKHWPDVPNLGDVTAAEFPQADVITAGFPCQDISLSGKGAGLTGSRSGLWREVVRAIRVVRPKHVLLENVAILVDRGLGDVLGDLAREGYDTEWSCVSAAELGASQIRKRIWILANPHDPRCQRPIWAGQSFETWSPRQTACSEPLRSDCGYWPPGPFAIDRIPRMADEPSHRPHRLRALGNALIPDIPEAMMRSILDAQQ